MFTHSHTLSFSLSDRAMPSVAKFSLSFDKINDSGTFSEGDTIRGKVSLELLKATKVLSLRVKAQGDVNTKWTERDSDGDLVTRSRHCRLFKKKEFLISTKLKETVLSPGSHSFSFNLQIPFKTYLPSSFSGEHGSIRYQLEAKLCRRTKRARIFQQTFTFWSKLVPRSALFFPQTASTKAEITTYKGGCVEIEVRLERNTFAPGEIVNVVAKITNTSNHIVKAGYELTLLVVYSASSSSISTSQFKTLQTGSGRLVRPQSEQEEEWPICLSPETPLTLHNCELIKSQYNLQVALQVLVHDAAPKVNVPLFVIAPDSLTKEESAH
ncbi:hypothetical protein WMY93_004937 [Mugilogobius chulae]|uniref:Arrestin C-terminal-like domain-containing protein n=1 Tax=Mugilogobius chulae TaxID=88201 RepID=A0AAW0PZR0_9GOBI